MKKKFRAALSRFWARTIRNTSRRFCLALDHLEDRLVPANILVSVNGPSSQQLLKEYTPAGALVGAIAIPPGGPAEDARDLIVSADGRVHVYNGTFDPYLSTYTPAGGTWAHRTHPGWSTINNVRYGGVGVWGSYAFATDTNTAGAGDAPMGIVRFNLADGTATRFADTTEFIDLSVGLDGKVYALNYAANTVTVYHPQTLALERSVALPVYVGGVAQWWNAVTANAAGEMFLATNNRAVHRFDSAGVVMASATLGGPSGPLSDIDVSAEGRLLVGTTTGHAYQMTDAFTNVSWWYAGSGNAFVAFGDANLPATAFEPNESLSAAIDLGTLGGSHGWNSQAITTSTDVDWFKFTTTLTGGSGHEASIAFQWPGGDLNLALYNSAGSLLTSVNSISDRETISLSGRPAGTYYLKVAGTSGATNPYYSLSINAPALTPQLSVSDVSVVEGNSGTVNAAFLVNLGAASAQPVTVNWATANGTAAAGSDYTGGSGTLTFNPGETSKTVNVAVLGETALEFDETFTLNLSGAVGAPIVDGQGVGTIRDDDRPSLAISDASVTEGNSGYVGMTFNVTLSFAPVQPVTVNWATASGTAVSSGDFSAGSGTLTFNPGETSKTVTVNVIGDTAQESNEYFYVDLSNPTNAVIGDGTGVGTIVNDDVPPALRINDATVTEGHSGTTAAMFTVTLSPSSTQTVTVNYATSGSSATSSVDFTAASGSLTFAPGETSKTVFVSVLGDLLDEHLETFYVNLSSPVNATLADSSGLGTISDDDAEPSVSVNDISVTEGNSGSLSATFTLTMSAASGRTVYVYWSTANGTATAGSDYTAVTNGTTYIYAGETSKTVTISVTGDTAQEPNETFFLNLTNTTYATLADNQGVGTIIDNDGAPTVSINDVTLTEGNSGTVTATFLVSLSGASTQTITVNWATADGSALAGSDYTAANGTVTFNPGETSKPAVVIILADTIDELNETFSVLLSGAVNTTILDGTGVGTITDDDTASIAVGDVTLTEGHSGTVTATFTVTLSTTSDRTVTANWATSNGTATAGSDYTAGSGTLTFNPGETSKTVTVLVNGDRTEEANEVLWLNLSNVVNASVGDSQAAGTITNDDWARLDFLAVAHRTYADYRADGTLTQLSNWGSYQNVTRLSTQPMSGAPMDERALLEFNVGPLAAGDVGAVVLEFTIDYAPLGQLVRIIGYNGDGTITLADGTTPGVLLGTFDPMLGTGRRWVQLDRDAVANLMASSSYLGLRLETTAETVVRIASPASINAPKFVVLNQPFVAPQLSIGDAQVTEGNKTPHVNDGTVGVYVPVTLASPAVVAVTATYQIVHNTTSDADVVFSSGTVTIPVGQTSSGVWLNIPADNFIEGDETFFVRLTSLMYAAPADTEALVTILDNDTGPTLADAGPNKTITAGQAAYLQGDWSRVRLSPDVTVTWDFGDGTSQSLPATAFNAFWAHHWYYLQGPRTVTLTVTDPLLGNSSDTTLVTVNNANPTVTITAAADPVAVGQPSTWTFNVNDVEADDLAAGLTLLVHWGDGTSNTVTTTTTSVTLTHAYAAIGGYTIAATVTDRDHGNGSANRSVNVRYAAIMNGMLVLAGTPGDDQLTVRPGGVLGWAETFWNGVSQGNFNLNGLAGVAIYGYDGNDTLEVVPNGATVWQAWPAYLFGGAGNDTLTASGTVSHVLIGGDGNDTLNGGPGGDLLIGSAGADILYGNGGSDLLIGGTTIYDADRAALLALRLEWARTDVPLQVKVDHLNGTLAGGQNGSYVLNAATVLDDAALDDLWGGGDLDWFFTHVGSPFVDQKRDPEAGEFFSDL